MNFFIDTTEATQTILSGSYDLTLVVLSYVIASAASYVALLLVGRLRASDDPQNRRSSLLAGSMSLGGGIWSMHFIGMLAFRMPIEVRYDGMFTLFSLLIVVVVTAYAFTRISHPQVTLPRLASSGFVLGMGIVVMHYTGMAAMRMDALIRYRPGLFILSIMISIAAATAALWLAFHLSKKAIRKERGLVIGSSLVMGLAVTGMHYTGMASAVFVKTSQHLEGAVAGLDKDLLVYAVTIIIAMVLCLGAVLSDANERMSGRRRLVALTLIMSVVSLTVLGITLYFLYKVGFDEQRKRLTDIAQSRARILIAAAQMDLPVNGEGGPGRELSRNASLIKDEYGKFQGFGKTGSFILARANGDEIVYFSRSGNHTGDDLKPVAISSELLEPVRQALSGKSGTVVGLNFSGKPILAAFEPAGDLGWVIVARIDIEEVRAPYIHWGLVSLVISLVLIMVGVVLSQGIANPLIRQLEENERKYRTLFESATEGVLLLNDEDIIVECNDQACRIFACQREDIIGHSPHHCSPTAEPGGRDLSQAIREQNEGVLRGEAQFFYWKHRRHDGMLTDTDVSLKSVKVDGRDYILASIRDITDRKKAEQKLEQVLLEKERIETELQFATLVQEGFLPKGPPRHPNFKFAAKTIPARFVGGDFFDFIPLGENKLGIVLGDVSGKGVSAALYMARLLSDFRYISQIDPHPTKVMENINKTLFERSKRGMFATAVYLLLDLEEKKMTAANAGHHSMLFRDGEQNITEKVRAGGMPLGIQPDTKYDYSEILLHKDEMVLLYTDGAIEPQNSNKEAFGLQRLSTILSENGGSPEELIDKFHEKIQNFTGDVPPHDDMTFLSFKVLDSFQK